MRAYLLEIRNRLILILLTWLSMFIISYLYKETLLFLIVQPNKLFKLSMDPYSFYFIFTNITEIFSVYLQLTIFLSVQIVFVSFIYHCFNFISFALFKLEYFLFRTFLKLSFIVWCLSIIFTHYVIIPLTWDFFFSFQKVASDRFMSLHFEAKLNEYLDFYIFLYYLSIFYFQIFTIIIFFFSFLNRNEAKIKKFRKLYYYIFVVFSTLISPPDIVSQILISVLLIFNYEILTMFFITKVFLTWQPIKTY